MAQLDEFLRARAQARANSKPATVTNWTLADLADYPYVVVGTFSAASATRRWILPSAATYPYDVPQTVSEATRDWLSLSYKLPIRTRRANYDDLQRRSKAMPLVALRGWRGEAAYLDVEQAYRQIIAAVGWDVEYWPQRGVFGVRKLPPVPGWLWAHKLWRSLLYTLAMPRPMLVARYGKLEWQHNYSQYENARVTAIVMDVLNGLAYDLHRAGAVYIHTDGCIMPLKHMAVATEVYASWGLTFGVKSQGDTYIAGVGSYRCGSKSSKRLIGQTHWSINVPPYRDWLRNRVRKACNLARKNYHD